MGSAPFPTNFTWAKPIFSKLCATSMAELRLWLPPLHLLSESASDMSNPPISRQSKPIAGLQPSTPGPVVARRLSEEVLINWKPEAQLRKVSCNPSVRGRLGFGLALTCVYLLFFLAFEFFVPPPRPPFMAVRNGCILARLQVEVKASLLELRYYLFKKLPLLSVAGCLYQPSRWIKFGLIGFDIRPTLPPPPCFIVIHYHLFK